MQQWMKKKSEHVLTEAGSQGYPVCVSIEICQYMTAPLNLFKNMS